MIKVKFLVNKKFSNDGINIINGQKDVFYDLNDNLAKSFLKEKFVEKYNETKSLKPELENKAITNIEENKEELNNEEEVQETEEVEEIKKAKNNLKKLKKRGRKKNKIY